MEPAVHSVVDTLVCSVTVGCVETAVGHSQFGSDYDGNYCDSLYSPDFSHCVAVRIADIGFGFAAAAPLNSVALARVVSLHPSGSAADSDCWNFEHFLVSKKEAPCSYSILASYILVKPYFPDGWVPN